MFKPGGGGRSSPEGGALSCPAPAFGDWSLFRWLSSPVVAELWSEEEVVRGGRDAAVASGLMSTIQHVMLSQPAWHHSAISSPHHHLSFL